MIQLWPHQDKFFADIRDAFRGSRRVLGVAPTGSGKTRVFSRMVRRSVDTGRRVLVIAHRSEILRQIANALKDEGVACGMIRSQEPMNLSLPVQVASIQTLAKRLDVVQKPDFIVIDEAHHLAAASYCAVLARYSGAHVLGVTATPERLDGKGLGDYFDVMVRGPEVQWLIDNGFLARPRYINPSTVSMDGVSMRAGDYAKNEIAERMGKPAIIGDAVKHYLKYAAGKKAITFCVNLKHAGDTMNLFNEAGIKSEVIDGTQTDKERSGVIERLATGATLNMVSCDLVGEGFDCPAVGCAILLRPTASLGLHLQQIGRCLRRKDDGSGSTILDHVGNCDRHGPAEEVRDWSLEGGAAKRRKREVALETRRCEKCFLVYQGTVCPECQTVRESKVREIEIREGELREISARELIEKRQKQIENHQCRTYQDFQKIEKERGYKRGWAYRRWQISRWNKSRGVEV